MLSNKLDAGDIDRDWNINLNRHTLDVEWYCNVQCSAEIPQKFIIQPQAFETDCHFTRTYFPQTIALVLKSKPIAVYLASID